MGLQADDAGAQFGSQVSFIGDVNQDGFDDFAAAAPGDLVSSTITTVEADGTVTETIEWVTGQIYVFLGSDDGIRPLPAWSIAGDDLDVDHYSLSAGDLNMDGFVDLVVGSPDSDVDRVDGTNVVRVNQAGKVQVFFGSEEGLSPEPSATYKGEQTGGHFGHSVQVLGDVNGDGFPDLMIGAPDEQSETVGAGRAYLYLGSEEGLSPYPAQVFEGDANQDRFGASIAAAGDVNNDGFADAVIGAPQRANAGGGEGAAFLYFGSIDGLATQPLIIEPDAQNARFGFEVAGAGDVNGDGHDDVFVRTLNEVIPGQFEGQVLLYLGGLSGLSRTVLQLDEAKETVSDVDVSRRSIAAGGDFNNDSLDDFAVGAWQYGDGEVGAVFAYAGKPFQFEPPVIAVAEGLTHTYDKYGNYTLSVGVTQTETASAFGSTRVHVSGAPLPAEDRFTTDKATPLTITAANLLANDLDPDAGDVLSFGGVDTSGLIGQLVDTGDWIFDYFPNGQFDDLYVGESATDSFSYTVIDQSGRSAVASVIITVTGVGLPPADVVGRHIFYNNSALDGNDAGANADDDNAIAEDKRAWLPGDGDITLAHFTNYASGINGIMVDIDAVPTGFAPTAADFSFLVTDANDPGMWVQGPTPTVDLRRGAGTEGSDRITIVWEDGAIVSRWLQVTVRGDNFGLSGNDVFYLGNAAGDIDGDRTVGDRDLNLVLSSLGSASPTADIDRSGLVEIADVNTLVSLFGAGLAPFSLPALSVEAPTSSVLYGPAEKPALPSGVLHNSLLAMPVGPVSHEAMVGPSRARALLQSSRLFVGPKLPDSIAQPRPLIRPARSPQTSNRIDETSMLAMRRAYVDATFARIAASRHSSSRARYWFLDDSLWEDDLASRNARHRSTDVDQALEDELVWY
ncbi:MAG: cadherin-like domain-containing protein [Thermoguttaceae bacterium]